MFIHTLKKQRNGDYSVFGGSPRHEPRFSQEEAKEMAKLRKKGYTYQKIGDIYGCRRAFVRTTLIRCRLLVVEKKEIPEDYINVMEYMEIYNETRVALYYHMRQGNLDYKTVGNKKYIHKDSTIKRRTISEDKIDMILELQGTDSCRAIAKIVGCGSSTVERYIKLLGD